MSCSFLIGFLQWWWELLADWLALQNVLTYILRLPCPYFLRSGLLWHGPTLRLADWLSSPLANDGGCSLSSSCTSPTPPPSLSALLPIIWAAALDTTRKFHRFCWCSQWVMAMWFIASANAFGVGSEQGAGACRIASFPVVSFQIQKCSLLNAYKVWINNVSVMSWCLSSARLVGSDRRQVDGHWDSWMWVINWKWWRDVETSLLQSAAVCWPYIVKTGSVWVIQHGESEKTPPTPPSLHTHSHPHRYWIADPTWPFPIFVSRSNVVDSPYSTTMWKHLCAFSEFSQQGGAVWRQCSPLCSLLRDLVQKVLLFFSLTVLTFEPQWTASFWNSASKGKQWPTAVSQFCLVVYACRPAFSIQRNVPFLFFFELTWPPLCFCYAAVTALQPNWWV